MVGTLKNRIKSLPKTYDLQADAILDDALTIDTNETVYLFLKTVIVNAPYLRDIMVKNAAFLNDILQEKPEDTLHNILIETRNAADSCENISRLMCHLRQLKNKIALLIALCDLGGVWKCDQVTKALSNFADNALLAATRFSLCAENERRKITFPHENPETNSGLILLAMGKHGADELNYSSDIDLIAFYEPQKITTTDVYEIQPAMVRIVKRIIKIMQERTEDGYVFRTDLRLRPDPGATAIAISTDAALHYYESLGQNWERAAFIKARPVACDYKAAEQFLKELSPFIWRKYMDFATIADVQSMKSKIHQHKGHGKIALKGHNVKLGRGGIREIEFFVQTQQLISGGRNPLLRARQTVTMLELLSDNGWVDKKVARELQKHYVFARNLEHRIQMRHDEQTHILPEDEEGFASISCLMGYDNVQEFEEDLKSVFQSVSKHYDALFQDENSENDVLNFQLEELSPDTYLTLSELGFENTEQIYKIIKGWEKGRYRALRTQKTQKNLTKMRPKLLESLGKTVNPDQALFAFDEFLKSLPAGIQLFSLLGANEHLLDLLARLMGSAPRLSKTIARYPHIFDALLEPAFFNCLPDRQQLIRTLESFIGQAMDYQEILERTRIFTQEQQFLIGTRLLSKTITMHESQQLYSDLADCVLEMLLDAVCEEMEKNHGVIEGAQIAILAMGKLGGREMSPTSDVDIILIYDAPGDVSFSQGDKPLEITQYYSRLTQRFIAALSAPTGNGVAYCVDMRLRPSGRAGPLATNFRSFEKYQKENAWTWEHMALTRARVIGCSHGLNEAINAVIKNVLTRKRDIKRIKKDIIDMNTLMHETKNNSKRLDIKTGKGGLVDLEFFIQSLQLIYANKVPSILKSNSVEALQELSKQGLLPEDDFENLSNAWHLYSSLIQIFRLCFEKNIAIEKIPEDLVAFLCSNFNIKNKENLENILENSFKSVRLIFEENLENDLLYRYSYQNFGTFSIF